MRMVKAPYLTKSVAMKLFSLASVLALALLLSACVVQPAANDEQIFSSYLQGHLQMLSTTAPWMSEAQRDQHARAQASEMVKHLREGQRNPLVVIPIPEAPASDTRKLTSAPASTVASVAPLMPAAVPSTELSRAPAPTPLERRVVAVSPAPIVKEPASVPSLNGRYVLDTGSYSIQVEQVGNDVAVVEPNKRSVYTRQGDGSYQFYNPNTGSTFSLRFIDADTVVADRVPSAGTPSTLKRAAAPLQARAAALNRSDIEVAERYSQMALSDPANAQAWTMCAAVAFKRSQSDAADFARYASQAAQSLKLLVADSNPCADAIPDGYW